MQATNGKVSTDTVTVKTDNLVPSVQFTPTLVFTKAFGLLKGLAFDDSGVMSAVEVSLNGGAFKKALLGDGSVLIECAAGRRGDVVAADRCEQHRRRSAASRGARRRCGGQRRTEQRADHDHAGHDRADDQRQRCGIDASAARSSMDRA